MPAGMIYKFQILRAVFIALCPEHRLMTVFRIILPRYEDEWFAISIRDVKIMLINKNHNEIFIILPVACSERADRDSRVVEYRTSEHFTVTVIPSLLMPIYEISWNKQHFTPEMRHGLTQTSD